MSTSTDPSVAQGLSSMLSAIRGTPSYFADGIAFAGDVGGRLAAVERVIVCGMGGSAFPADLLALSGSLQVSVVVNRDYELSSLRVSASDLVVVCSYSGNTEETLGSFDAACATDAQVVAVSAGGQLADQAHSAGVAHILFQRPTPDFQPRAATGYFLGAFAALLEDAGVMPGGRAEMLALGQFLNDLKDVEARANRLAEVLLNRIAVIYAPNPLATSAARICKIKLNENAKVPAFWNAWPELNHNEMVGFTRALGPFTPVLLVPSPLSASMQRRIDVTAETFKAHGLSVEVMEMPGETPLQQAVATIMLFDFASCSLAERAGIDPNPVAMIEDFKRRLRS